MNHNIPKSLLSHFGLNSLGFHKSKKWLEYREDIIDSINQNQMLVIPGEIGAGKTTLFESAKNNFNKEEIKFVYVRNYYKERLTVGSILNAVIYDISDESPRRDLEARSRQFIRLVGESFVSNKIKVCIIIEEAHRLHANTLRAIKELREAGFANITPLFSIALLGHPLLAEKINKRREVYWRANSIELMEKYGWMDEFERVSFIKSLFGSAVTQQARVNIAAVCKEPLEIIYYVREKMKLAKKVGYKIINEEIVEPTLEQLVKSNKISYGKIQKATGIPKSTVFNAINDAKFNNKETLALIRKTVNDMINNKTQKFAKAS